VEIFFPCPGGREKDQRGGPSQEVPLGPITRGKGIESSTRRRNRTPGADRVTLLGKKKDVESTARLLKGCPSAACRNQKKLLTLTHGPKITPSLPSPLEAGQGGGGCFLLTNLKTYNTVYREETNGQLPSETGLWGDHRPLLGLIFLEGCAGSKTYLLNFHSQLGTPQFLPISASQ